VWLWIVAAVLLGATVFLQRPGAPDAGRVDQAVKGLGKVEAPDSDVMILLGKLTLAMRELSPANGAMMQAQLDAMTGFATGPGFGGVTPSSRPHAAADMIRSTIVAGETLGAEAMSPRLEKIRSQLDPSSELLSDVATLARLYVDDAGVPSGDVSLSDEARAGLEQRHGWFGRLALSRGKMDAPVRREAVRDGWLVLGVIGIAMTLVGLAGLTGLVVLGLATVAVLSGTMRWRFVRPDPRLEWPADPLRAADPARPAPKSVWLETVVVFLAGFLGLKLVAMGVAAAAPGVSAEALTWGTLIGQWLLVGTIFWPVLRGMSWERYCGEIGWHRGEGVGKEIGWGVLGYFAGLPVYFAMAVVVVLVMMAIAILTGSEPLTPDSNKVVDIVGGGSPAMLLVIYLLATVWAPVVEESVFRGALFRHLRRRWALPLAALGSCMVFAVLHGYLVAQLFIVGTLGFWFALMREWRGSLIGPVVGHFIHNAFVLGLIIAVMSLASG
jgi:membrane protease YdiL (CAAX protease family)